MSLPQLIKEKIAKDIGYETWLKGLTHVEAINTETGEARICCVAHRENESSASFNVSSGLWKCQSAKCNEAGDAIDFYFFVKRCSSKGEAIQKLARELGILKEITNAEVEQYHR